MLVMKMRMMMSEWDYLIEQSNEAYEDALVDIIDAENKYVKFPKLYYLMSRPSPFQERFDNE
jgi:hypothetical protein